MTSHDKYTYNATSNNTSITRYLNIIIVSSCFSSASKSACRRCHWILYMRFAQFDHTVRGVDSVFSLRLSGRSAPYITPVQRIFTYAAVRCGKFFSPWNIGVRCGAEYLCLWSFRCTFAPTSYFQMYRIIWWKHLRQGRGYHPVGEQSLLVYV